MLPLPDSMPKRIAYFRKRAELSQKDLAILCGWSSQTRISNYENETRSPSIEDVSVIAMVLGVNPRVLVFGVDENGEGDSVPAHEAGFSNTASEISINPRTVAQAKTVLAVDTLLKGAEAGVMDNVLLMELEALASRIAIKMKLKSSTASGA